MNKAVFRDVPFVGTEFSQFEDEYFLNKDGVLELMPAKRDCQAIIDSQIETTLQKIYDALLDTPVGYQNPATDYINERNYYATNLDILIEADNVYADYKAEHPEWKGTKAELIKELKKNIERSYEEYEAQNTSSQKGEQEEFSQDGEKGA